MLRLCALLFCSYADALVPRAPVLEVTLFTWNVHWQCGSDFIQGCRETAVSRFKALLNESTADIAVAIEIESSGNSSETLDFTTAGSPLAQWNQVNGSCPGANGQPGDVVALLIQPHFKLHRSGGGCLGGSSGGNYTADARAFAVALVQPHVPVRGCEATGLCVIGLHAPHINITQGMPTVERVCAAAKAQCVVAAGDWNAPVEYTPSQPWQAGNVSQYLSQLLDTPAPGISVAVPDVNSCCYPQSKYLGVDDHVVTNVPNSTAAAVHLYPYQMGPMFLPKVVNTEEHRPLAVKLELPAALQ